MIAMVDNLQFRAGSPHKEKWLFFNRWKCSPELEWQSAVMLQIQKWSAMLPNGSLGFFLMKNLLWLSDLTCSFLQMATPSLMEGGWLRQGHPGVNEAFWTSTFSPSFYLSSSDHPKFGKNINSLRKMIEGKDEWGDGYSKEWPSPTGPERKKKWEALEGLSLGHRRENFKKNVNLEAQNESSEKNLLPHFH